MSIEQRIRPLHVQTLKSNPQLAIGRMTAMHPRQPYKGQRELQRSKKHENLESLNNKRQKSRKNKLTNAKNEKYTQQDPQSTSSAKLYKKGSKSETRKGKNYFKRLIYHTIAITILAK